MTERKRGGKASAKSGRAGAKGRTGGADTGQQDGGRNEATGGARGGRTPVRRGGRGGMGGRGQQRQQQQDSTVRSPSAGVRADGRLRPPPGRGASPASGASLRAEAAAIIPQIVRHEGGKRAGGSESQEPVVKAGQAGQAMKEFAGTQRSTGKRTNPGEPKVLWSPGKRARNISSLGGGSGSGGTDESSGRAEKGGDGGSILASLAKSYKERHGEDLSLEDDDMEADGEGGDPTVPQTTTKRSGGGSSAEVAAATAKAMSPAKLAAEVQRARARAREERFGSGSKSEPPTAVAAGGSRPVSPGKVTVGGTAEAETSSARARGETRPLDLAAAGMREFSAINVSGGAGGSTDPPSRAAARTSKSTNSGRESTIVGVGDRDSATSVMESEASGSGAVDRTAAVNDFRRTQEASPSTTSAAALPVSASLPVVSAAPTASAIPSPPPSTYHITAEASAPKTPAVAIEASEKSSSATAGASNSVQSPAANQILRTQQYPTPRKETATPSKVHTLRLRPRADTLPETNSRPKRAFDGGVEESKSFDPPNPSPDSGVEECKGFDPPNLPNSLFLSATSARGSGATLPVGSLQAVTPTCTQESSTTAPVYAPAVASRPVVSSRSTQSSSALPRSGFWGPSFGIVPAGAAAFLAAQSGSGSRSGASNPWILSPDAPTFAKNVGRPLARFSSQSSTKRLATTTGGTASPVSASCRGRDTITNVSVSADVPSDSTGRVQAAGGASTGTPDRASLSQDGAFSAKSSGARTPSRDTAVNEQTEAETSRERGLGASHAENQNDREPLSHQVLAEHRTGSGGNGSDTSIIGNTGVTDPVGEEDAKAASDADDVILGVRVSRSAKDLLERLKRERQESLNFERKLTQALLDL